MPDSLYSGPGMTDKTNIRVLEVPLEAATLFWAVGPAFQEVRLETSSLLHEMSSDAQMVGLLMRR